VHSSENGRSANPENGGIVSEHALPDHATRHRPPPVTAAGNSAITAQLLAAAEMN
jgi:hypothetical protein